jgi:serine protease Do
MKRSSLFACLTTFALGASAAHATGLLVADTVEEDSLTAEMATTSEAQRPPANYSPSLSLAPLVQSLQPAVVNIHVEQKVRNQQAPMMEFFAPFFGSPMPGQEVPEFRVKTGQGSGFIISADGYMLTNNHVVADADRVTVKMADEREFEGKVVGTDSRIDIALVKIESKEPLPFVDIGKSDPMQVGDWVVAIGNPFGLSHTVTAGIVSAKGRVIGAGPYDDFIQTDASINPGNSGGPLFNLDGEVIGINTAITRSGQGIGFAVPTDMVSPFLDDLKNNGEVARGWLGVGLQNIDEELAAGLNIKEQKGVLLSEVHTNQPGDKAGLVPGDVITSINGDEIGDSKDLIKSIGNHRAGDSINIDILRSGVSKSVKVKLGKRPDEQEIRTARYESNSLNRGPRSAPILKKIGIQLEKSTGKYIAISQVDEESPASGRLRVGDIILQVNGKSARDISSLVNSLHIRGDHILFVVQRDQRRIYVAVPKP